MTSNIPEVLGQASRAFADMNRLLKDTQENLGRFSVDLKELTSSGRGLGRLVSSMEKLSSAKLGGGLLDDMEKMAEFTRKLTEAQVELARTAQETATAWREMAAAGARTAARTTPAGTGGGGGNGKAPRAGGSAAGGHAVSHTTLVDTAMGLQMGGDAGASFFEKSIKAELQVQGLMQQFRYNTTLKDSDLSAIRSKAEALTRAVPGTTIAENLHTILDAFTVTGQIGEAMVGSDAMAKLGLLLKTLPGSHQGDEGFAAAQAVELLQRYTDPKTHQVNLAEMTRNINAMAQVATGTGGRADPAKYVAFAKQARVGGMMADDQFLYRDLPATMIALGGSRAGTGDAATYRQFIQGRMTQDALKQLQHYGIVDAGAKWSHGRVQDMTKHLQGADEFVRNPIQWMRDFLMKELAAHGVDVNNRQQLGTALGNFASTNTGLGFLSEGALGLPGIDKEAQKIAQTTTDPYKSLQAGDPNMKVAEFHAAENELMVQLGNSLLGPAIDSLKALTSVLRGLTDWAKANPNAAKDITVVAAGLAVLAKAAGDAGMVIFLGAPVVQGFGALAKALLPFGKGGAAAGAIEVAAGGASIAGSLAALAVALIALPPALRLSIEAINKGLGITPPQSGASAKGAGHGPWEAPTPAPPGRSWSDIWRDSQNPSQGGAAARGAGNGVHATHAAYTTADVGSPIILMIDGRVLGQVVGGQLDRASRNSASVQFGRTAHDGRMTPVPTTTLA